MAAYWGIAAHSAYDMFSRYKYLPVSVILVFSHPSVYGVGVSFWLRHFLIIAYLYLFKDSRLLYLELCVTTLIILTTWNPCFKYILTVIAEWLLPQRIYIIFFVSIFFTSDKTSLQLHCGYLPISYVSTARETAARVYVETVGC